MVEVEKPPPMVSTGGSWARAGRPELCLGVEEDLRPARKARPGMMVRDLAGLARRLEASRAEVSWDERFPGHRRFYVHDNSGNKLEFMTPSGYER